MLVDELDTEIGTEEKIAAHQKGLLHRAFSVFVFNPAGELLLQKRAAEKYHSAGLWSNTCCSHPRPGEATLAAARRRLREEMGFDCELREAGTLLYETNFENGLIEHEFDHFFIGNYRNESIVPDPQEVSEWLWVQPQRILLDIAAQPNEYTHWLKLALADVVAKK